MASKRLREGISLPKGDWGPAERVRLRLVGVGRGYSFQKSHKAAVISENIPRFLPKMTEVPFDELRAIGLGRIGCASNLGLMAMFPRPG